MLGTVSDVYPDTKCDKISLSTSIYCRIICVLRLLVEIFLLNCFNPLSHGAGLFGHTPLKMQNTLKVLKASAANRHASRTITDQTKRLISSSWQFPYKSPTAVQLGKRVKSRRVKRIGLG